MSPKELQLTQGETGAIGASVKPAGTPVSWSSSDDAVAAVSNGTVTAVGEGSVVVTASIVVDGVTYSDTANVTVEAQPQPVNPSVELDTHSLDLNAGGSAVISATTVPDDAVVTWEVQND